MNNKTNEAALEQCIEDCLLNQGFIKGLPQDFNRQFAIDEKLFWQFLEQTQKEELSKLSHQSDYKLRILTRLDREIAKYGIIHLLKKGFKVDNASFTLLYQLPLHSCSEMVKAKFEANIFSVVRQLRYSQVQEGQEIDLVLFVNGLPIITCELKNAWTGQTAREQGINQYKIDRDATQPLLQFARCIVHFAADTDEVYMTTKLQGKNTFFLPFNKGNGEGKDNPGNPNGHKTAYLWKTSLQEQV